MDTISIYDIINAILGFTRDLLVYFSPLIGLLGGLKFLADWIHKLIFGKKVQFMPVTQEFLIRLSAFWLSLIISFLLITWLSGERRGDW